MLTLIKTYLSMIAHILGQIWAFICDPRGFEWAELQYAIRFQVRKARIILASFEKTPEEYAEEAGRRSRESGKQKDIPRPPGTVRVRWFLSIEATLPGKNRLPDLCADVPLEPNGDLDLSILHRLWGLENAIPVDWARLRLFYPGDPNRLSSMAVKVLTADPEECLRIVEKPSWQREDARDVRRERQEWIRDTRRRSWQLFCDSPYLLTMGCAYLICIPVFICALLLFNTLKACAFIVAWAAMSIVAVISVSADWVGARLRAAWRYVRAVVVRAWAQPEYCQELKIRALVTIGLVCACEPLWMVLGSVAVSTAVTACGAACTALQATSNVVLALARMMIFHLPVVVMQLVSVLLATITRVLLAVLYAPVRCAVGAKDAVAAMAVLAGRLAYNCAIIVMRATRDGAIAFDESLDELRGVWAGLRGMIGVAATR